MSFRRSDRTGPAVIKKTPRRARLAPACLGDVQAPKERPRLINPEEEGAASAGGRPRFRAKAAEAPRVLEFIEHVLRVGTRPVGFLHLPAVEVPGPIDQGDRRCLFGLVPKVRAVRGRSHALQPPHEAHRPGGFPVGELDPGLGDQARPEGGRSRSVVFLEPAQGRTDGRGPGRDEEALGASGLRLVPKAQIAAVRGDRPILKPPLRVRPRLPPLGRAHRVAGAEAVNRTGRVPETAASSG
jgi:hypothetical protein